MWSAQGETSVAGGSKVCVRGHTLLEAEKAHLPPCLAICCYVTLFIHSASLYIKVL